MKLINRINKKIIEDYVGFEINNDYLDDEVIIGFLYKCNIPANILIESRLIKYINPINLIQTVALDDDTLSEIINKERKEVINYEGGRLWDAISLYQPVSDNFIEKYKNKLNWNVLAVYNDMSVDLLEDNTDKFNDNCWENISRYQNLNQKFIDKYEKFLNFEIIKSNCRFNTRNKSFFLNLFKNENFEFFDDFLIGEVYLSDFNNKYYYKDLLLNFKYELVNGVEFACPINTNKNSNYLIQFRENFSYRSYRINGNDNKSRGYVICKIYYKDIKSYHLANRVTPLKLTINGKYT